MMGKQIKKRVLHGLLFIVCILLCFNSCVQPNKDIQSLPSEVDVQPNVYLYNATIYVGNTEFEIEEYDSRQCQVLRVIDDLAYYAYIYRDESDRTVWGLASINLHTHEIKEYCELENSSNQSYNSTAWSADKYEDRSWYYYNHSLVLNDKQTVLVYDLNTQQTQRYAYEDYEFPKRYVYSDSIDPLTLQLHIGDETKTFTLEQMAEQSKGIAAIYALKDQQTNNDGKSPLYRFFWGDCVQIMDDRIYAIGEFRSDSWGVHAVIFEYTIETDTWSYVGQYFTKDVFGREFFIV